MPTPTVYRLSNTVQHYDWGSHTAIPGLLGTPDSGEPQAELWLGAHPSAPSMAQPWGMPDAATIPLDKLIQQNPTEMLGERVVEEFGPKLPYLMKVLAAGRALSLQVHPAAHLARAGFNRENREEIPITAPHRNFRDANHKPEMIVAVTEFHALAGLRAPRVVLRMIDGLPGLLFGMMHDAVTANPSLVGLRNALTSLLEFRTDPLAAVEVELALASVRARIASGSPYEVADQTAVDLGEQFPGDVGALSSYLLNRVTLQPGEALFIDDGEVHSYLKGLAIEVMANSDNVLRAGLTHKHVDTAALLECMSFHPGAPSRPEPFSAGESSRSYTFKPPVEEFAITVFDLQGEPLPIYPRGPRVLLVLAGELRLMYGGSAGVSSQPFVSMPGGKPVTRALPVVSPHPPTTLTLRRGDSIFIPDNIGPCLVSGQAQLANAWVP